MTLDEILKKLYLVGEEDFTPKDAKNALKTWILTELVPKKAPMMCTGRGHISAIGEYWEQGYNQCLKEIKEKLNQPERKIK